PAGGVCKTLDTPRHDATTRPTYPSAVDYPIWDCHSKLCTVVICSGLLLREGDAMDITLALTLTVPTIIKEDVNKVVIVSSAQLQVDQERFRLSSRRSFHSSQVRLILETGFFKRGYQEKLQEAVQEGQQQQQQTEGQQPETEMEPEAL
ncbi:unnamed protein product, partial [Lampetra planeri]